MRGSRLFRFALADNPGKRCADWNLLALINQQVADPTGLEDLHFDRSLVGFDYRNDISRLHCITGLLQPFDQCACGHVRTKRGHGEGSHAYRSNTETAAATIFSVLGSAAASMWLA